MEKLLTIVIPAYNMEKYLHRCLDSILTEKVMDKVQVLVVNDGSKDRTSEIAHEYEAKYPHYIQVIDKENGNYGSCMNVGLSLAKGKYFRTLDADDWYDTPSYEKFVPKLDNTEADMLLCERFVHYESLDKTELEEFPDSIQCEDDLAFNDIDWNNKALMSLLTVNCICYKTSLLKNVRMKWSEKVFYSDTEYNYFPLNNVNTLCFLDLPVYCYFIGRTDQSISSTSIRKNFNSFYVVSKRILEDYVHNNKENSPQRKIQKFHLIRILRFLYQSLLIDGFKNISAIRDIEKLVKKDKDLFQSTSYIDTYRGYHYVYLYRNNFLKFLLMRLDYRIRSNNIIRRFIGK